MKKSISIVLAVIMVLSMSFAFTGCGKDANVEKEKLVCGVTIFDPMNYKDENDDWTGFDTEFAQAVGEKLDMDVDFQEIDWDNKYLELESGTIDCIWNGFTANTTTDDGKTRSEVVDFSYGYMLNEQCVVVQKDKAGDFKDIKALKGKNIAAEKSSAGDEVAKDAAGKDGKVIAVAAQKDSFLEVKTGAADCGIVDILLAQKMVGSGDFGDLVIADIQMDSEIYAIGFEKGSDLRDKVNEAIQALFDDGTMDKLAEKYGLENTLKLDTETEF